MLVLLFQPGLSLDTKTSGNIFIISAFEDEGDIVGAYVKSVSKSPDYRGNDSLFFFRMNFDGEFLNKKGYDFNEDNFTRISSKDVKRHLTRQSR